MSQGRRPQFAFETEPLEFPPQMGFRKKIWAVIDRPYSLGFATVGSSMSARDVFLVQSPSNGEPMM